MIESSSERAPSSQKPGSRLAWTGWISAGCASLTVPFFRPEVNRLGRLVLLAADHPWAGRQIAPARQAILGIIQSRADGRVRAAVPDDRSLVVRTRIPQHERLESSRILESRDSPCPRTPPPPARTPCPPVNNFLCNRRLGRNLTEMRMHAGRILLPANHHLVAPRRRP